MVLFSCMILFSAASFSQQYTVANVPRPNQYDATNYVSNPDGILSRQAVSQINRVINLLEIDTKAEMAVVALNSVGHNDIKDFGIKLFENWEIGKKGADNGLLILFVLDQRAVNFETGYGIEGILPDAICMRIIQEEMIPLFREGNYDAGMLAGIDRAASILRQEPVAVPQEEPVDWGVVLPFALGVYLIFILISMYWMNNTVNVIKKNPKLLDNIARYNALKNQKAGMMSIMAFIIPFFALFVVIFLFRIEYVLLIMPLPLLVLPANLYAKGQMRQMRRQPIRCDVCDSMMHILSEKEEDQYLNMAQQFEEQLSAVDYDVFLCDKCKNTLVLTLDKPSAYSKCSKCGTKAFIKTGKKILIAPTYISTGVEQTTCKCKFCGYEEHKNTKLPRLQRSNGAAVAGGIAAGSILRGGGSGGFGGGGFGGGRSGGGGATGRW